jgi:hypothetical protein
MKNLFVRLFFLAILPITLWAMTGSTFDPANRDEYSKYKLEVANLGVKGTCVGTTTSNIDYTLADDMLLVGIQFGVSAADDDDTVDLQVVHPVSGVLKQFVTDWNVFETVQIQMDAESIFPAKVPAGLIIRLVYHCNSEATTTKVKVNLKLHKILI